MITYPFLNKGATIGVTAPSSGVPTQLHEVLRRMQPDEAKRIQGSLWRNCLDLK